MGRDLPLAGGQSCGRSLDSGGSEAQRRASGALRHESTASVSGRRKAQVALRSGHDAAFCRQFKSGKPVYEQVLLAVKRALAAGQLKPGDRFPSVRVLSQELRINPNTAHKVIGALVDDGLLSVQPGVGKVVSHTKPATAQEKQ